MFLLTSAHTNSHVMSLFNNLLNTHQDVFEEQFIWEFFAQWRSHVVTFWNVDCIIWRFSCTYCSMWTYCSNKCKRICRICRICESLYKNGKHSCTDFGSCLACNKHLLLPISACLGCLQLGLILWYSEPFSDYIPKKQLATNLTGFWADFRYFFGGNSLKFVSECSQLWLWLLYCLCSVCAGESKWA